MPTPFLVATDIDFQIRDNVRCCYQQKDKKVCTFFLLAPVELEEQDLKVGVNLYLDPPPDVPGLTVPFAVSEQDIDPEDADKKFRVWRLSFAFISEKYYIRGRITLSKAGKQFPRCPITAFWFEPGETEPVDYGVGFLLPVTGPDSPLPDPDLTALAAPFGTANQKDYLLDDEAVGCLLHDEQVDCPLADLVLEEGQCTVKNFGSAPLKVWRVVVEGQGPPLEKPGAPLFQVMPGRSVSFTLEQLYEYAQSPGNPTNLSWKLCAPASDDSTELATVSQVPVKLFAEGDGPPLCTLTIQKRIGCAELVFVADLSGSMNMTGRIGPLRIFWQQFVERLKTGSVVDRFSAARVSLVVIWNGQVLCRYPAEAHSVDSYDNQYTTEIPPANGGASFTDVKPILELSDGLDLQEDNPAQRLPLAIDCIFKTALAPGPYGSSPIGDAILRALGEWRQEEDNGPFAIQEGPASLFQSGSVARQNRRYLVLLSDAGENSSVWKFLGTAAPVDNVAALASFLLEQRIDLAHVAYVPMAGMWEVFLGHLDDSVKNSIIVDHANHPVLNLFLKDPL
ncbi:hypothetical protein [Nannocystis pusilla]|uniref:hypothetical protein n=1 Tax=Nannocystis pusilla TaxID=889268 RepID=UPI003DA4D2E8